METKELKIVVPNGYEIDKENSTLEKIVFKKIDDKPFKKIDDKPKSWKEYCNQQQAANKKGYFFNDGDCFIDDISWVGCQTPCKWKNVLPSIELTKSFLAMMQLVSLRQAWVGDWQPDWNDFSDKWCIVNSGNKLVISDYIHIVRVLSFPTKEMVNEFMDCFWDLLEIAKPLI